MKKPALQNKRIGVLRMAFRARNVCLDFRETSPWVRLPDSTPYVGWICSFSTFQTSPVFPSRRKATVDFIWIESI